MALEGVSQLYVNAKDYAKFVVVVSWELWKLQKSTDQKPTDNERFTFIDRIRLTLN